MEQNKEKHNSDFEREKVCYEQNYLQFRSLNQIMWQVPIIAMTLTGGLWFGAAKVNNIQNFQYALLVLAFIGNAGLIVILTRIRYVMGEYLDALRGFHPKGFVEAKGENWLTRSERVVGTFRLLLGISAVISLIGIWMVYSTPVAPRAIPNKAGIECDG